MKWVFYKRTSTCLNRVEIRYGLIGHLDQGLILASNALSSWAYGAKTRGDKFAQSLA